MAWRLAKEVCITWPLFKAKFTIWSELFTWLTGMVNIVWVAKPKKNVMLNRCLNDQPDMKKFTNINICLFYYLLKNDLWLFDWLPWEVGISSCAPWIPWIKCPEARISCGIGAGCWDPIKGFGLGIVGACGEEGWGFILVITFEDVSGMFKGRLLLGVGTVKVVKSGYIMM